MRGKPFPDPLILNEVGTGGVIAGIYILLW